MTASMFANALPAGAYIPPGMKTTAPIPPPPPVRPVADIMLTAALEYAALGWAVFPLAAGTKDPAVIGGNGFKSATVDAEQIRRWWAKYPNANIGFVPHSAGLAVIDVDVKNGATGTLQLEVLESKHGKLPDTEQQVTPSTGAHLFYSTNQPMPNTKIAPDIDIRCANGYVLLAPSVADGRAYEWVDGYDAATGSAADFPPLPQWVIDVQQERVKEGAKGGKDDANLEYIEPSDNERDGIMHRLAEFLQRNPKSKQRYDGARDGMGDTSGSAMDMSMCVLLKIGGFNYSETRFILEQWPHGSSNPQRYFGDRYWVRLWQRSADPVNNTARITALFDALNTSNPDSDEPPVAMNSGAGVDVWSPPGIAGDICRLMAMRARRERPEIYPLAALQLLSLAANGRGSDYTNKLNLITLSIASTAAGKETPQDVVKTISNKLGLSRYIMGDMGSFKDMITNIITGQGTALYIMDEVHSMMDSMKSKNAASYETKIEAEILKLTTTALYTFRGADKRAWFEVYDKQIAAHEKKLAAVDKDTPEGANDFANLTHAINQCKKHRDYIENGWPDPYTGIMGHSVPERLDKFAGDPENIASGLLGRSLIARCAEGAERLKQPDTAAANILQADIVHRLERLVGSSQHIDVDDDARDYMAARSDYYEQETVRNDQHMGAIYRRSTEQLYKVATVLAIETSRITLEHAKYAAALVESSNSDIRYILTQAIAAREGAADSVVIGAARLRLLKAAKPLSGVPRGELKKTVTRSKEWGEMQNKDLTRDRFEELLADLVGRGELVEVKTSRYRSLAVT